MHSYERDD